MRSRTCFIVISSGRVPPEGLVVLDLVFIQTAGAVSPDFHRLVSVFRRRRLRCGGPSLLLPARDGRQTGCQCSGAPAAGPRPRYGAGTEKPRCLACSSPSPVHLRWSRTHCRAVLSVAHAARLLPTGPRFSSPRLRLPKRRVQRSTFSRAPDLRPFVISWNDSRPCRSGKSSRFPR